MIPTRTRRILFLVAFFFALHSVAFAQDSIRTFRGETMATSYMVKIFGASNVDDDIRIDIDTELRRVNDQMSTYLKTSELSRFNASDSTEWFAVSRDTATVVQFAQELSAKTNGAFDVTVGPIVNAWGFGTGKTNNKANIGRTGVFPEASELMKLRTHVGYEKLSVRLDPPALRKSIPELNVDLSAIAKGHGVDRVVGLLAKAGAKDVFVEIGGEVRTSGDKNGEPWKVGIQKPDATEMALVVAHAMGNRRGDDEAMATSGDYRTFFRDDDKRYSHTIDPRTAKPTDHDLASVSVVAPSCMAADAWATAINVVGPNAGLELARKEDLNVFLITRTDSGFNMVGTGTLAQYGESMLQQDAAIASPKSELVAQASNGGLMPTILMTAVAMGLILTAMAVGVIFGRKSISGSCGGLANKQADDGSVSCSLCSNPADACKELRERMQKETT